MRTNIPAFFLLVIILCFAALKGKAVAQKDSLVAQHSSFELPGWISDTSFRDTESHMVFGISDPGVNAEIAYRQARCRANMMAKLFHLSEIGIVIAQYGDVYDNLLQQQLADKSGKFVQFLRVEAYATAHWLALTLVDSASTVFGEKILLYRIDVDSTVQKSPKQAVSFDFLKVEYNTQNDYSSDCFYALNSEWDTCSMKYRMYKNDEISAIESQLDSSNFLFPFNYYKYYPAHPQQLALAETNFNGGAKLYYGLWKAYFEAVVHVYSGFYSQNVKLNMVQELYADRLQNMNQLSEKQLLSAQLKTIKIGQNELKLQLEIHQKNSYMEGK